jgi:lipoprotein-anchoring transpeptidase ErfK/SrfK
VDSSLTVKKERLNVSKSAVGYKLDKASTLVAVSKALRDGKRDAKLKVDTVKPRLTEYSFGKTILVVKSERHLYLYNGPKLEKDYDVAIGTPGRPTPSGWWVIENKRYMPTWTNPAPNGWGAGMPAYIGPGYSNPLGTRALDLNASGIRIHGSSADYSIGTAASHGCMRMHMWDIEDLYDRVEVGTRVIITPE